MKILVFDDNPLHRDAAVAQLKGHNLTVVGTYDEAQKLVAVQLDWAEMVRIMKDQFGDFNPYKSQDEERKRAYSEAQKLATEQATYHPDFDVVLVDLLVPASSQAQGRNGYDHIGTEMPIGSFIGLLAAKNGAKYVAVLTDSNHHDHPASACFDSFNKKEHEPTPFTVNGCKVIFCNNRGWVQNFDPSNLATPLEYEQYKGRKDTVRAKNWSALLEYLVNK